MFFVPCVLFDVQRVYRFFSIRQVDVCFSKFSEMESHRHNHPDPAGHRKKRFDPPDALYENRENRTGGPEHQARSFPIL
jgi:hypothetical protein